MNANFEKSMEFLRSLEGGFVINSSDPGGETKFGISKRRYPNLDIKNLTWEYAKSIYKKDYWDRFRLNEIISQRIADLVFSMLVVMNPLTAIKGVQRAINKVTYFDALKIDGVLGPLTIKELNSVANVQGLSDRIRLEQISIYTKLLTRNQNLSVFFKGWINRALYEF